jgi:hypothetical protein
MKTLLLALALMVIGGCESSPPSGDNNNNTTNNTNVNNTNVNNTNVNNTNNSNTCNTIGGEGEACLEGCTDCLYNLDCVDNICVPVCGNNEVQTGETCDGTNFDGNTCEALGFSGGSLTCNACELDTLSCECGEGYIYEPTLNLCHIDTTTTVGENCWGIDTLSNFDCYWEFCEGEATITKTLKGVRAIGDPMHCGNCITTCSTDQECICVFDSNASVSFHTTCTCE